MLLNGDSDAEFNSWVSTDRVHNVLSVRYSYYRVGLWLSNRVFSLIPSGLTLGIEPDTMATLRSRWV